MRPRSQPQCYVTQQWLDSGKPRTLVPTDHYSGAFMHKILIATLAAGVMAAGVAQSATTTASFQVTANVQATCSASAATLAFGNYTPGGGALTGNSNITVKCTKGTPFTVTLNAGATTGTFAQRLMANGGAT